MAREGAFLPLRDEQARASRPGGHVWLSASAGTGKTHVLTARVLRLLLSGVEPERILCLTFTKAGAAEMAARIHDRLARWVRADDGDIFHDLEALGEESGPEARGQARLLFARVLEATGGGLRIQTIHSFCQSLLAAFPLEAGLVPGFRPLDERGHAMLARGALIAMLERAEAELDQPVLDAVAALSRRMGEAGAVGYLARCVAAGPLLEAWPADPSLLSDVLLTRLGLPVGDLSGHVAAACVDDVFPVRDLRRIAAANTAWGSKTGLDCADAIANWLAASPEGRADGLGVLRGALLTQNGEVKNRNNKNLLAAEPDYVALGEAVGGVIAGLDDLAAQVAHARLAAQGLLAGRAYARAYRDALRAEGAVDFDDLISRAAALLGQDGVGAWIRFRLDQRIDHILVDEAQDTNSAQWTIVDAIVDDYFELEDAPGDGRAARTLFVVGDTKQAIFGFQGTSPRAFMEALGHFRARADHAGQSFETLPLALSFRTVPAVLEVVDATLAAIGHEAVGLAEAAQAHGSARRHPGEVLLLAPTVRIAADGDDADDGEEPEGEENWLADHERLHAQKIAAQVKAWVDPAHGRWLRAQGRRARPGDVLILVRSRGTLARLIVARLYEAGVPVAGVDRLRLQAPLAVRDLLSAIRFSAQPDDDLNLACLLVSPLIGWSQDDLMHRAIRAKGVPLWAHLRATQPENVLAPLRALLVMADYTTPYQYLEAILSGVMAGRARLLARLGAEAGDAIDELLNSALAFETDEHPSLQSFINWFDREEADIKRELTEGGDAVRVMTVHGAKGLEAPIVILADATYDPARAPRSAAVDWDGGGATIPLIRPSGAERVAPLADALAAAEARDREEHWRLLYVGMTRAQELLAIGGALGPRARGEVPTESWHARAAIALAALGADEAGDDIWGHVQRWEGRDALSDAPAARTPDASTSPPVARPAWLDTPAPAEARPPRPLAPSAAVEDDVPDPPPSPAMRAAAERGRLLHALFERLPDVPAAVRRTAALAWLGGAGGVADPAQAAEIADHALAVIEKPGHAALFSADALAEAPIAAVVDGHVIAGTVDRLLVRDDSVHVVDFKTGRFVPVEGNAPPLSHVRQMAAYAAALAVIFPDRLIRASLLYTSGPTLIDLPDTLLAAHKPGFAVPEQKLAADGLEEAVPPA